VISEILILTSYKFVQDKLEECIISQENLISGRWGRCADKHLTIGEAEKEAKKLLQLYKTYKEV